MVHSNQSEKKVLVWAPPGNQNQDWYAMKKSCQPILKKRLKVGFSNWNRSSMKQGPVRFTFHTSYCIGNTQFSWSSKLRHWRKCLRRAVSYIYKKTKFYIELEVKTISSILSYLVGCKFAYLHPTQMPKKLWRSSKLKNFLYLILFISFRDSNPEIDLFMGEVSQVLGHVSIGWTLGEEVLFTNKI